MKDLYLRFNDVKEMRLRLADVGFKESVDGGDLNHPNINLDIIGVIYSSIGEEEPFEHITEPGYHANLRVLDDEIDLSPLDSFIINPKTPVRIWA